MRNLRYFNLVKYLQMAKRSTTRLRNMSSFLTYWDKVVKQWFRNKPGKELKEQNLMIDAVNKIAKTPNNMALLQTTHMPEPYWGNPYDCSIVIANYNPGGGADRNRHTYWACRKCPESFINHVLLNGYYDVVKDFPIINNPNDHTTPHPCWWKEYGGRKWWLKVSAWLKQFEGCIPEFVSNSSQKPFVIEFYGWHSPYWPSGACSTLYKNKSIKPIIENCFIRPLVDAIHNSTCKCGICVGKQFYDLFISMGLTPIPHTGLKKKSINIFLFNICGSNVFTVWGPGRNRFPRLTCSTFSAFVSSISNQQNQ